MIGVVVSERVFFRPIGNNIGKVLGPFLGRDWDWCVLFRRTGPEGRGSGKATLVGGSFGTVKKAAAEGRPHSQKSEGRAPPSGRPGPYNRKQNSGRKLCGGPGWSILGGGCVFVHNL